MITVAIISPLRFREPVDRAIAAHDFGCSFRTYEYDSLTDIDRFYPECREACDIMLFTGELGYHYMLSRYPDCPVPCDFTVYGTADVLSILLSFHLRHPDVPLNRVYLDFLTPSNHYLHIREYLPPEQLPYCFESGNYDYAHITQRGKSLWDSGRIDYVLSRSISNLTEWERLGIPYEAQYPTERMIRDSIEEAVNRERLKNIHNNTVVTVVIDLPEHEDVSSEENEYRLATLYKFLVDSRREYRLDYDIRQGFERFVCRRSVEEADAAGLDFHRILLTMREHLSFPFSVGVGIHANERISQYYAERALLESGRYGRNEGFLIQGEPEEITGPLSQGSTVRNRQQDAAVARYARKLGIESANLLRVMGLYRSDPGVVLTAGMLEPLLGITLRSARRILQKLYDLGMVMPVADTGASGRGRPIHRYVFVPEVVEQALHGPEPD